MTGYQDSRGGFCIHLWLIVANLPHIDGLVQERRNSIGISLELRLSCTNPSIWCHIISLDQLKYGLISTKL